MNPPDAVAECRDGRRRVGSICFTVLPLRGAIDLVLRTSSEAQSSGTAFHFANAYNIALADSDPVYRRILDDGDFVFSDGTPVVWAGRWLHRDLRKAWERVYGPDVMAGVMASSNEIGPRHFLLGGSEETMHLLIDQLAQRWPLAQVVGWECPPFRVPTDDELEARDRRIADSGATCVWVGLGTPKQDYEVHRLARALPVSALAIGAAFDFIAGTVPQAPNWMQRGGLEWAYRFAHEPRRLARRYLWGNPRFGACVAKQRLGVDRLDKRRNSRG